MPLFPLRPHQQIAIDGIRQSLSTGHKRPSLMLPTGAGKTCVAAHMVVGALAKRKRVSFTVPRLSLIDQTFERFAENGIDPISMGVIQSDHPWRRPNAPIQICSIPTLATRGFPDSDFIIVDENHLRFEAIDQWQAEQPNKIFVGLSATPWARGMGDHWDDLIIPTSIAELIEQEYLSKFKVYAPSHPDLSGIKIVAGDYHEGQLSARMSDKQIVGDIVANWLKHGNNEPTLGFYVDLGHAQAVHDQFAANGVTSAYIDAKTLRDDRKKIIDAFQRREVQIINSVGTMTTGVDVDCRCLIMARPTKSEILFVQIFGRLLRIADGKEYGVCFDHSDNHLRLGMVTDIHHDTLRTARGDEAAKKKQVQAEMPKPFECPKCSCLIPARSRECANCGWVHRRQNNVETTEGELVEFGGGERKIKARKREPVAAQLAALGMQEVYSQLLSLQGTKKPGWVTHNFFKLFDTMPPWTLENKRRSPCAIMKSWIKSQRIAWVKDKEKYGNRGYPHAAE